MKNLTIVELMAVIYAFLQGNKPFSAVRNFVFQYYESETEFKLDSTLEVLFPVLAPYLEFEESFGDKKMRKKFQRLYHALQLPNIGPELAVFALNLDKIRELTRKLESKKIDKHVYDEQLKKLSPANFSINMVRYLANNQNMIEVIDQSKVI